MAITPPTVGVVFLQAEVNAALAAVCAFIDADRSRLDTAESDLIAHAALISAGTAAAAAAQSSADLVAAAALTTARNLRKRKLA